MRVLYRDKLGRFTKASRKTARQFSYDDGWKLLDVTDNYYTKPQVRKLSGDKARDMRDAIVRDIREASIRKPKSEKFQQAFFATRKDNSDLFSFMRKQQLDTKLRKLARSKAGKGKVMIAEVITTVGDKKRERIVSRQFKLTHLGHTQFFVSGKRKGKAYTMSDHVASFVHDSVNEYTSDELKQFTLYATETYGQRQRQQVKAKKDRKRIARSQQTFEIRIRFISKNKAGAILQTSDLLTKRNSRSTRKTKRKGRS